MPNGENAHISCDEKSRSISKSHYDVAVIGAGLLGCFAARHLALRGLRVAVLERGNDVCTAISRSSTAIVYAGYDMRPNSLKAQMCVRANANFDSLCEDLGVKFNRCGSLMCAFGPEGLKSLEKKLQNGRNSGIPNLKIIDGDEARRIEPSLSDKVIAALYSPTTGTVNPWHLAFAAAENAAQNGAVFYFGTEVTAIAKSSSLKSDSLENTNLKSSGFENANLKSGNLAGTNLKSDSSTGTGPTGTSPAGSNLTTKARYVIENHTQTGVLKLETQAVINCAGMYSDKIHSMLCKPTFTIVPTTGTYMILDTYAKPHPSHVLSSEPEGHKRGATLVPTVDGNLLLGPSSESSQSKDEFPVSSAGLEFVRRSSVELVPDIELCQTIRSFGALRPNPYAVHSENGQLMINDRGINDFVIVTDPQYPGFVSLGGVKTPGLTCCDELGKHLADIVCDSLDERAIKQCGQMLSPAEKQRSQMLSPAGKQRRQMPSLDEILSDASRPSWHKRIVCRCRHISAGQVVEAIRRSPGARTVDGVKRRIGCGTGRCQGGYCSTEVTRILASELDIDPSEIAKDLPGSSIFWQNQKPSPASGLSSRNGSNTVKPTPATTPSIQQVDVAVIGAGPAGLSAAIAAREAGAANVLVIDRSKEPGGILPQCIHSGFGLSKYGMQLTGPEFIFNLVSHAKAAGVQIVCDCMVLQMKANPENKGAILKVAGPSLCGTIYARSVVLASGCRERPMGSLSVEGERPAGVICAGSLQRIINIEGQIPSASNIVVLGSGDVGLIVARRLSLLGKHVHMVLEKKPECGGQLRNRIECLDDFGIPLLRWHTVAALHGHSKLEAIEICKVNRDGKEIPNTRQLVSCDLLVVSIGMIPETELARDVDLTEHDGLLRLNDRLNCADAPWLFACGNVHYVHTLASDAAEDGTVAGKNAAAYSMGKTAQACAQKHLGSSDAKSLKPKQVICTECPKSCVLTVQDNGVINAYGCNRGKRWLSENLQSKSKVLTATMQVRLSDGSTTRLPVKSSKPIDVNLHASLVKKLGQIELEAPIYPSQSVVSDIDETGCSILACTAIS